jgi:hypothetical protein
MHALQITTATVMLISFFRPDSTLIRRMPRALAAYYPIRRVQHGYDVPCGRARDTYYYWVIKQNILV